MNSTGIRSRASRGEMRRRSSASMQRKYDYRGVKTALGFVVLGAGALYLLYSAFSALFGISLLGGLAALLN